MKTLRQIISLAAALCICTLALAQEIPANYARAPRFKALLLYSEYGEQAHVDFSRQSIDFFRGLTDGEGWILDVTTSLSSYTAESLAEYTAIISVNAAPGHSERALFEEYMENGGGWIGFHAAGYNDKNTAWPWFDKFFGAGVFKCNNWPPQPVLVSVDSKNHPVTRNLPSEFVAPSSEWYQWSGNLRRNREIEVLMSLSPKNYPLGLKDIVYGGDWPIVWTNKNYRMIYLNMGHGGSEYIDASQNLLFVNALRWIVSRDPKGNPFAPAGRKNPSGRVVVGYVTSWSRDIPYGAELTHINYAFAHVTDSFDAVRVDNPARLEKIVSLKKHRPDLKVLVSVGGWGSGRFSEMASDKKKRAAFAKSCKELVERYGLDGIDIDWEYPTSSAAGISSSENDTENFSALMKDLRHALGKDKILTLATVCSAQYIDFPAIISYVDFVNVMSYDMGFGDRLNAPLHDSPQAGRWTTEKAVKAHLDAGVPACKLVVGIPFYGRGTENYKGGHDYRDIYPVSGEYEEHWDESAMVPYLTDKEGKFVFGFDNPSSIRLKCEYIVENGLHGAMFWDYAGDDPANTLCDTIADIILN